MSTPSPPEERTAHFSEQVGPDCATGQSSYPSLRETYHMYFDIVMANTDELLKEVFKLRYQVYCVENDFEDPAANADGLETDVYDENSVHALLIYNPGRVIAGTVRLILPSPDDHAPSFPIQNICQDPIFEDPERLPLHSSAEISRFCISKEMRRRRQDTTYPANVEPIVLEHRRRVIPNMMLGLVEALIMMSVKNGVTHWCAEMEPALLRLLARNGIHFNSIGPLVNFHGARQPSYIPLQEMLNRAYHEKPEVWELLTANGAHLEGVGNQGFGTNLAAAL